MLLGLNKGLAQLDPNTAAAAAVEAAKGRLQTKIENDPNVTTLPPGGVVSLPDGLQARQQPQAASAFQWGTGRGSAYR